MSSLLSIVVPCHNEAENVAPLLAAIDEVLGKGANFEIIFVDDGSSDATLERVKRLRVGDPRVRYISFALNYGHQRALMAGLRACRGALAISMDADLQHPPELIPLLLEQHRATSVEVVAAQRRPQQQGALKEFFSTLFYRLFALLTGVPIVPGASDFRLYTRRALDVLCAIREREPFLRGMIPHLGLPTALVLYDIKPRLHGKPSYSFGKSLRMALQALLRYSTFPAKASAWIGLCGIILSVVEALHYLYLRLFTHALVPGQADLMVFLALIGGIILCMISLQMKVLAQIHALLRAEPDYLIKETSSDSSLTAFLAASAPTSPADDDPGA